MIVEEFGLKFQIDKDNNNANVEITPNSDGDIFIPRFIKKDSVEYPILRLAGNLRNMKGNNVYSVKFPEDSEIHIIEQNAFISTEIKELFIPASVKELKEGWCSFTYDLYKVIVSPNNSNFSNFHKDIIIGKSTLESESFDALYFASRKIIQIKIPSFIKKIAPYSLSYCKYLKFVDFPEDSSLEIIDNNSFSQSSILSITIPKHVKIIGKNAFEECQNLSKIKISEDSELESICSQAFSNTLIEHLYFPPKLKELQSGWCESMKKLKSISISPKNRFFTIIEENLIVGKSNPKSDDYDILYFVLPGLKSMTLPSNIKKINDYAFMKCKKMNLIKIPDDSKLEIIGKYAFYRSGIKSIDIPKSVTIIDDGAFVSSDLEVINFHDDSNLKIIGEAAFCSTSITSIKIPKHVSEIKDRAFSSCHKLNEILFSDDAEIENIGQFAFRMTYITKLKIPKNVKIIKKGTFEECRKLEEITFAEPSETRCIENSSFKRSSIKRIEFPSNLSKLEIGWNKKTDSLNKIDIPNENNNFKIIDNEIIISNSLSVKSNIPDSDDDDNDDDDFQNEEKNDDDNDDEIGEKQEEKIFNVICFVPRNIKKVTIPKYIKYIDSYAFSGCENLKEVFISNDSELEEFKKEAFSSSSLSSIFIPSHVKIIDYKCFYYCNDLKSVEFANNSQLEFIGKKSFPTISIENISIPNSVKIIRKDAFKSNDSSSKDIAELFSISENSQIQCINEGDIRLRSIKRFKIPNQVKIIKENAFYGFYKLETIDISEDSELTTIEDKAFRCCSVKKIYIPPLLKNINNFLLDATKLTEIAISPNNKCYSAINNGKMVLGKIDINSDNYDVLLYSTRDIQNVIIPSYIKKINSKAFENCEYLRDFKFEENSQLEIIDKNSFEKSSIEYIKIPNSVKIIDDYAFSKCKHLYKFKISKESQLNFIGKNAFYYTDFDEIFIPKYVEIIDNGAFMNSKIKHISFAKDSLLKRIGVSSFSYSRIYSIEIPQNVKEIEELTFSYCKEFYRLDLEEDSELQIIHRNAFCGSKISKLKFPPKLIQLENGWSDNIEHLDRIKISPKNEAFNIIDKKIIVEKSNPNNNQFDVLTFVMRDAENVTIPSYIKKIRTDAFSYCEKLKDIKIDENSELEIIDDRAFYYASCKSNLLIPKSVKIIGDSAFSHFRKCKIEFQDDSLLEQIENDAFYNACIEKFVFSNKFKFITFSIFEGCFNLKEIQMSDNVELIDPYIKFKLPIETINIPAKLDEFKIFDSLPNLTNVIISPKNKYFNNFEGKLIIKKTNPDNDIYDTIYYAMQDIGNITIPSYFTKIDSSIFSHKNIDKVSFLDDSLLKIIKGSAFEGSTITEICIPKHVKIIGSKSFYNCSNLKKIEFVKDSELEIIKSSSFEDSSLTTIDIPKNVKIIENNAFRQSKLQVINFAEDSKLEFIGCCAFKMTSITQMKIPKNVEAIKARTFEECSKLEEITFVEPSKTTCIETSSFSKSSIKRITFPSKLSKLKVGWNENTDSLNKIDIPNENNNFKIIDNEIIISNSLSYHGKKIYYIAKMSSDEYDDDDDNDETESSEDLIEEEEDINQDEKIFNVICFVPRNIKKVAIPKYIKCIDSYAFSGCKNLEEVFISNDSELEELKKGTFSSSSLSSIFIPSHVKIIDDKCFNNCSKLKSVEFANNSQLEMIGEKCFQNCEKLTTFDIINCEKLTNFDINNYDHRISIYKSAFSSTALRAFAFPKGIMKYNISIFDYCENLNSIEFLCDTKFELSENDLIEQVSLISFPSAQSIKIDKPRYGNNKNEVIVFSIPFAKIEYMAFE